MSSNTSGADLVTSAGKINKAARGALVVVAAGASLVLPALVPGDAGLSLVTPAHADGTGHSLVIKHQSADRDPLIVCKDWSGSSSHRRYCPSAVASLRPGDNTKSALGWDDVDGVRLASGTKIKVDQPGLNQTLRRNCFGPAEYRKVSPSIATLLTGSVGKVTLYVVKC